MLRDAITELHRVSNVEIVMKVWYPDIYNITFN